MKVGNSIVSIQNRKWCRDIYCKLCNKKLSGAVDVFRITTYTNTQKTAFPFYICQTCASDLAMVIKNLIAEEVNKP